MLQSLQGAKDEEAAFQKDFLRMRKSLSGMIAMDSLPSLGDKVTPKATAKGKAAGKATGKAKAKGKK